MSRLPLIGQGSLTPEQDAVYQKIISGKRKSLHGRSDMQHADGALRGPFNAMLYNPVLGDAMQTFSAAIRFETELDDRLRELAILIVAVRWQSQYEWFAHERIAREVGIGDAVIDALHAGAKPDFERDDEALVYAFTTELLDQRRVGSEIYARAVEALGHQGVVELVATLGNYTLVSMVLNCFEVPIPDGATLPFPMPPEGE